MMSHHLVIPQTIPLDDQNTNDCYAAVVHPKPPIAYEYVKAEALSGHAHYKLLSRCFKQHGLRRSGKLTCLLW